MPFIFTVFLISFLVLLWSGRILPRALHNISKILHLSEFITAFFLVAFATSIPELFVGISSVFQGVPSVSLGNVMGANIVNLTLVVGLSTIFAGTIAGDGRISSENFWLIFLVAMMPILLAMDGIISRGDGIVLLFAFALYMLKIFRDQQYFHKEMHETKDPGLQSVPNVLKNLVHFFGGMFLLLVSSLFLVWSSKAIIAEYFVDSFLIFGVLFIALGTALPELMFGIQVSLDGKPHAMLGNALGSVAFNAAAIVGIVALLSPIQIQIGDEFILIALFLFLAFALFHLFVYTKHSISRSEGFILVLVYLAFFVTTLNECVSCFSF